VEGPAARGTLSRLMRPHHTVGALLRLHFEPCFGANHKAMASTAGQESGSLLLWWEWVWLCTFAPFERGSEKSNYSSLSPQVVQPASPQAACSSTVSAGVGAALPGPGMSTGLRPLLLGLQPSVSDQSDFSFTGAQAG
jgi:hypothetical protein